MMKFIKIVTIFTLLSACKARSVYQSSLKGENAQNISSSSIDLPTDQAFGISLAPTSRVAFVSSLKGESALLDVDRGQIIWQKQAGTNKHNNIGEFSPSGTLLAVNYGPNQIKIIDPKTGSEVINLKPTGYPVSDWLVYNSKMAWSQDERMIAAAEAKTHTLSERERVITVWDTQSGDILFRMPTVGSVLNLAFSNDSKHLFSFSQDTHFTIYDFKKRTISTTKVDEMNYPFDNYGAFFDGKASFRRDGRLALVAWNRSIGEAGSSADPFRAMPVLVVVDLESGKKIWQREWHPNREERSFRIRAVDFDISGNRIGVYIEPGRWFIMNAINGNILNEFKSDEALSTGDEEDIDFRKASVWSFSKNLDKFFGPPQGNKLKIWGFN